MKFYNTVENWNNFFLCILIGNLGRNAIAFARFFNLSFQRMVTNLGNVSLFVSSTILSIFKRPLGFELLLKQFEVVGVRSFPIVLLTGIITGMVFVLQSYYQLKRFSLEGMMGSTVSINAVKELGPVLVAFVLSGRIGSAITAELSTMKVTEQVDAMHSMGVNPIKYLVAPRFLACFIMLPTLTIFSDLMGIIGGYLAAVYLFGINGKFFLQQARLFLFISDIFIGLLKAATFGMIIAIVGCYKGFSVNTTAGAEGVGDVTTGSAVTSIILILVMNFFLDHLLYGVLGL
ncbi:TPA: ABC transporter permease [Candidatus Poribacteria bacterium]|nr:ABC transporter permease [Candidatus Poribacteria bacterium]